MFEDFSLKLGLYTVPATFFVGGTWLMSKGDWFWGGVALFSLGVWIALHIGIVGVMREATKGLREKAFLFDSMNEFYRRVENMSDEHKYILGLTHVPTEITVKVNKTEEKQNEFSQLWQRLPVAPYKLKVIAQAALNGEGFSNRKWAGKGKLLSDPEWESLRDAMLRADMIEYKDPEHPQLGFDWTGLGIDTMTQAVKDTL